MIIIVITFLILLGKKWMEKNNAFICNEIDIYNENRH